MRHHVRVISADAKSRLASGVWSGNVLLDGPPIAVLRCIQQKFRPRWRCSGRLEEEKSGSRIKRKSVALLVLWFAGV